MEVKVSSFVSRPDPILLEIPDNAAYNQHRQPRNALERTAAETGRTLSLLKSAQASFLASR